MGWFQLPWMPVEWLWLALAGPFVTLLAQFGIETAPFLCMETISGIVGSFLSGGACITHASKNDNSLKVVTIKILAFLSGCILAVLKVVCSHLKKILAVNIRRMQCSGSLIRKVYYMPA